MQGKIDSVDQLKAQVSEAEKVAQTRLGQITKLRDNVARLERYLKKLQKPS